MTTVIADFTQQMPNQEIKYPDAGGVFDADDIRALTTFMQDVADGKDSFFPQPAEHIFQSMLAELEGVENCIAVTSCGTALDVCLAHLNIGPGDEVITTPLTFIATASSPLMRGAKIVLADIDEHSLNLSPKAVQAAITERTKCIIPVHFAGLPCDVEAFEAISQETGIPIIYDSAHAIGVKINGRPLASYGTASCYSFQFNKLMTCLGEGGAILTPNAGFAEAIRQLRTFGFCFPERSTYDGGEVVSVGTNYQMNKTQYVAGIAQLNKLSAVISRRRELMAQLDTALRTCPGLILPIGHGESHGSLHYIVRVDREKTGLSGSQLRQMLQERFSVQTRLHYPPLWSWEVMRRLGHTAENCPIAAKACEELLTLPVSATMTDEQCAYVSYALWQCLNQ